MKTLVSFFIIIFFYFAFFIAMLVPGIIIQDHDLILGGSSSVAIFFDQLQSNNQKNSKSGDFLYHYHSTGSSVAIKKVLEKSFNLGFLSRDVAAKEFKRYQEISLEKDSENSLQKFVLADDILVFAYQLPEKCSQNGGLDLNEKLLNEIYLTESFDWDTLPNISCEVDAKKKIIRINRENGSGTRNSFEKLLFKNKNVEKYFYDSQYRSATHIIKQVKEHSGVIVYMTKALIHELEINMKNNKRIGIATFNNHNYQDLDYEFFRPFIGVYLKKNENKVTELKKYLKNINNFSILSQKYRLKI